MMSHLLLLMKNRKNRKRQKGEIIRKHELEVQDEKCTKKAKFSNETSRERILGKAITEFVDTINLYTGALKLLTTFEFIMK